VAFWDSVDIATDLGVKSYKNPNLGAINKLFKPNAPNIETFILSKSLHPSRPNYAHTNRNHQVLCVSGPNMPPTNLKWRTAAILKNKKNLLYLQKLFD